MKAQYISVILLLMLTGFMELHCGNSISQESQSDASYTDNMQETTTDIVTSADEPNQTKEKGKETTGDTSPEQPGQEKQETKATILRDLYGIPHVYARNRVEAAYGWGYADAEDQRDNLLITLYIGSANSSKYFGKECGKTCLDYDFGVLQYDIPKVVQAKYASLKSTTRAILEAYTKGANAFFKKDPKTSSYPPITPQMIVGIAVYSRIQHARSSSGASNQLAITGQKTKGDTTFVLKDPHNMWSRTQRYIHLQFGDYDIIGNGGFGPWIQCGGNNFVSFGCTRAFLGCRDRQSS